MNDSILYLNACQSRSRSLVASLAGRRKEQKKNKKKTKQPKKGGDSLYAMVLNFNVFKKCSSDGKLVLYLSKRNIVDHITFIDPVGTYIMSRCVHVTTRRTHCARFVLEVRVSNGKRCPNTYAVWKRWRYSCPTRSRCPSSALGFAKNHTDLYTGVLYFFCISFFASYDVKFVRYRTLKRFYSFL